jgi:hypothetical protein
MFLHTLVDNAGVELDCDRSTDDLAQETAGISGVAGGIWCWALAIGGHDDFGKLTEWRVVSTERMA